MPGWFLPTSVFNFMNLSLSGLTIADHNQQYSKYCAKTVSIIITADLDFLILHNRSYFLALVWAKEESQQPVISGNTALLLGVGSTWAICSCQIHRDRTGNHSRRSPRGCTDSWRRWDSSCASCWCTPRCRCPAWPAYRPYPRTTSLWKEKGNAVLISAIKL